LPLDFNDVLTAIRDHPSYRIASFDQPLLESMVQTTDIPEMHDRLIVCEAKRNSATLITADKEIHAAGSVPVIW